MQSGFIRDRRVDKTSRFRFCIDRIQRIGTNIKPETARNLSVMPGCLWPDRLVDNVKSAAKNIQRMNAVCLLRVGKFSTIVRLDQVWRITKINNCTLARCKKSTVL